jgi:DNA-binding MarR family transcriptional regulator
VGPRFLPRPGPVDAEVSGNICRIVDEIIPEQLERAERLVLELTLLGTGISASMSAATGRPEFVGNAPLQVLCLLDVEGPARPSEIARVVGLTSGGTTKLLDRMEGAGLIWRAYGVIETDHRGVEVVLTDDGREMIRTAAIALVQHVPEVSGLVKSIMALLEVLERGN